MTPEYQGEARLCAESRMPRPYTALGLTEQRHEARPQHCLAAKAYLDQHGTIRGRFLEQILDSGNEVLVHGVCLLGGGKDAGQNPEAGHPWRRLDYQPRRPALPVVWRLPHALRQHPVEAGRPLLVDVQVGLRERGDARIGSDYSERRDRWAIHGAQVPSKNQAIIARCSSLKLIFRAWRAGSRCSGRRGPTIGAVTSGCAMTQASASDAMSVPSSAA
jgi:hypothetical protein